MDNLFSGDSLWKPVAIGGGGWVTGMDVAPDGTMVARTDTYGAYLWNGSSWTQIVTASSMPNGTASAHGVYEIRVAASNSNVLYMAMNDGIYKSVDKGEHWVKTTFPSTHIDPNASNRMDGQKMAIDPTNPNIVFAGTQANGLWVTRDGGNTWQKIAAVPQGTNTNDPGMTGIVIKGSTVFVGTAGSGVYSSSDGGFTWRALGGPADVGHAAVAPDGSYYATGNSDTALWKYANGSWTKLIANNVHAVSIDPFNPNHILVVNDGGAVQESWNAGASWGGWNWANKLSSANDVPWLETTSRYMATGALIFDPLIPNKLWQSSGVGVWSTDLPKNFLWDTPVVWHSQSQGIEQLVTNEILAPAGGDPVFASWDRAFFEKTNLDDYSGKYSGGDFSAGWSVDYASSDSKFLVGISDWWGVENSGFSTDGGATWQKFAGLPVWANDTIAGSIAASTPQNFIWVATGNQPPAYTLDGGKTWTNISIPGVSDWSLVHPNYYLSRTTITADRVLANTFYLYDSNSGVYRTTDGGVSWTKMHTGEVSGWTYWNTKIEAAPGSAGELFFTAGPQGSDPNNISYAPLMHSTNGGKDWVVVNGVNASSFGFGAAATAGGPASIYVVGTVNGKYGIWYSADNAASWTQVGERPMGSLDAVRSISGDMDKFGVVYVGFGGSGYAYLDFSASGSSTTAPTAPKPSLPASPTQTSSITAATDDNGGVTSLISGDLTNDKTPTLAGTLSATLAAGQKLVVYRDGQKIGEAVPGGTSWTFTDPGTADGKHDYSVHVVDGTGQSSALSGAFTLIIDTQAPTQAVSVTGVALSTITSMLSAKTALAGSGGTQVSGTLAGDLASDESVVVFRDGVRLGTATVSNGNWAYSDGVTAGTFKYTAQVQDGAGNLGNMSSVLSVTLGLNKVEGTNRNDFLAGTNGTDQLVGVGNAKTLGKGTIDSLMGGGGDDIFVLGDARGRFYDDDNARTSGADDFARITDFGDGDKIQLKGAAADYLQGWINNLQGFSGTGIYHDSNGNGVLDSRDELIALVQNHGPVDPGSFIYV